MFNGPELTLGALRIFHHPGNEMADSDIKNDCLSRNLCRQFTLPASDQHSGPTSLPSPDTSTKTLCRALLTWVCTSPKHLQCYF